MNPEMPLEHHYPHQIHDEVSPDDLARDFYEHPDTYPEPLRPHIEGFLSQNNVPHEKLETIQRMETRGDRIRAAIRGEGPITVDVVEFLGSNCALRMLDKYLGDIADLDDDVVGTIITTGNAFYAEDLLKTSQRIDNEKYYRVLQMLTELFYIPNANFYSLTKFLESPHLKREDKKSLIVQYIGVNGARGINTELFEGLHLSDDDKYDLLKLALRQGKTTVMGIAESVEGHLTREDQRQIMETEIATGGSLRALARIEHYTLLTEADKNEIFDQIFATGNARDLFYNRKKLPEPTRGQAHRIIRDLFDGGDARDAVVWMEDMKQLTQSDAREIVLGMCEGSIMGCWGVIDVLNSLPWLTDDDYRRLVKNIIEWEELSSFVRRLENIRPLPQDVCKTIFTTLSEQQDFGAINAAIGYLHGIDVVSYVMNLIDGYPYYLASVPKDILQTASKDPRVQIKMRNVYQQGIPVFASEKALEADLILAQNSSIEAVDTSRRLFGKYISPAGCKLVDDILRTSDLWTASFREEWDALGITATGQEGIDQLKQRLDGALEKMFACDIDETLLAALQNSPALRAVLSKVTGYRLTDWGSGDDQHLAETIETHRGIVKDGFVAQLESGYRTSEVYAIHRAVERDTWPEDVQHRYATLREDIQKATMVLESQGGFRQLLADLRVEIDAVLGGFEADIRQSEAEGERAKLSNLIRRRDKLQSYVDEIDNNVSVERRFVMNSPADFRRGFQELQPYKELHPTMRQFVFAWAMRKNPKFVDTLRSLPEDVTTESLSTTREFIEQIVNQQTYREYFINKKDANRFKQLSSTKSLEEALVRQQKIAEDKHTTSIQFMPTRGLMLDMSGQIANACWAERYTSNTSVAEMFPQISAVIMKARPGQENQRIVGAALLIESTDVDTDEDVLILRGTNPIQNYINKVDVAEFYDAIVDYTKKTAAALGRRPVIAIDDHSGGSGSNRPALFNYMSEQRSLLEAAGVDALTAEFNEYDLQGDCYYLLP